MTVRSIWSATRPLWLAGAMLCLVMAAPWHLPLAHAQAGPSPSPQQIAEARKAYNAGRTDLRAGKFEDALERFKTADAIMAVPSTRSRVAEALAGLGRVIEARTVAKSVAELPRNKNENEVQRDARSRAQALVKALDDRVATLRISGADDVPDAAVEVDGKPLPLWAYEGLDVDPGEHELRVVVAQQPARVTTITLAEGENKTLALEDLASGGSGSSGGGLSPIAWTGIGVMGAGLIVGTVAGIITLSRGADVEEFCTAGDGNDCPPEYYDLRADALTAAHVSTAGFAIAGVGAAVALIGLLVGNDEGDDSASVRLTPLLVPQVGGAYLGVSGTF